jgi:uncharacterized protein
MIRMYNPVGWFEVPVSDMARATTFYEALLGVKLEQHDMGEMHMAWFPMAQGAMGSPGTLIKGEWYTPSHEGTLIYFTAPEVDAMLVRVPELGGKVLLPKKDIGEYGFVAFIEDTEGNRIGLHRKKDA